MSGADTEFCNSRLQEDKVMLVPFARVHLEGALRLSQEMSWTHRFEDWEIALELGQGFVLEATGDVIGTAIWWPYGDAHACTGMIIVAKAAQGRGCGARLMNAVIAAAHPRTIRLNSTTEGRALYERRGFVPIGVIQQHQGVPKERHQAPPTSLVRAMIAPDIEAVARLDQQATGWTRQTMLRRLVEVGDGYVLVRDGVPCGYAVSRLFGRGHVIGPVVAESLDDARSLIATALAPLGNAFVRIDTSTSTQLGQWLEDIGLRKVDDVPTMVLGSQTPPAGPARMFVVANQSFN